MTPDPILELLATATRRLIRSLTPIVEKHDMSISDVMVLAIAVRKSSCRASELAERIASSPSTLTGVTDRLVARGFLERRPDPADRRAVLMQATRSGKTELDRIMKAANERVRSLLSSIPAERLSAIADDLRLLVQATEKSDPSKPSGAEDE